MKQYFVRLGEGGHCFMVVDSSKKKAIKRVEKQFGKLKWITEEELGERNLILEMKIFNTEEFQLHQVAEG
jgi:hypothetical protein